jgi:hypothetical protein
MNKLLLIANILFLCAIFSCTNSATSVKSNINSIVIDTENNYKSFTEDDWLKKDKELEELTKKFDENRSNYTPEQIEEINKLIGRYSVLKIKKAGNDLMIDLQDMGQQLGGAIEALTDTTK